MADTPSSILLLRLQSTGSNTNLWGGYINTAMQTLEQADKGYQTQALTGDTTISWTNYATGNKGQAALLKFTGSLTATATVTMPGYQNFLLIWNAAGQTVTVKCSGGTGVAIPNGRKALVFCDATDYYFAGPNYIGDDITETNSRDIADKGYVDTAIATASLPATSGTLLNSGSDTTAGYLTAKSTAKTLGGLVQSTLNGGGNEQNQFALDFTNLTVTTNVAAGDRFALYDTTATAMRYQTRANVVGKRGLILQSAQTTGFTAVAGNAYPCDTTSAAFTVTLPASATVGDCIDLYIGGVNALTLNPNGLKINGSTSNLVITDEQTLPLSYHSSGRGWV